MTSREKFIIDTYNQCKSVRHTMKVCNCAHRTVKKAIATYRAEKAIQQWETYNWGFTLWEKLFLVVSSSIIFAWIYLIFNYFYHG